jgi:hypothetical protein
MRVGEVEMLMCANSEVKKLAESGELKTMHERWI